MSLRLFFLSSIGLLLLVGGGPHLDTPGQLGGFLHPEQELAFESRFQAIPDPTLAEEHMRILTSAPHIAGSPEDKATADYVAEKFRAAGLNTEIVEYKVWMNYPQEISVDLTSPPDVRLHAPSREHVEGDPFQDDPRVVTAFNAMSPSGDAEAPVVYANYGSPADFQKLAALNISVRGKIVIARYGQNYRGTKAEMAEQYGAAGLILYSDPADDGWQRGATYPQGPWRPETSVQRGSISLISRFPGDVTTPGFASLASVPEGKRVAPQDSQALPKIPTTPISAADAAPILGHLGGPEAPAGWKGGLPFLYHLGPGPAAVKLHLKQDYQFRTIWDVIGTVHGSTWPGALVLAGNHRDAWVYGAVDPGSGTVAMLEAVHGIGELLKAGWQPKRSIAFCSWDGEEQGLVGSTEWGEEHPELEKAAVAYFNADMAVSGAKFGAAAVPSLKRFVRDITKAVPEPGGGSVYERWVALNSTGALGVDSRETSTYRPPLAGNHDVPVSDLGSGSDYTVFLQHLGIASTDIGSSGDYGVYHSVFDNFAWFKKFGDPDFRQEQKMARIFGLEVIRMSDVDVLPYDFREYGEEIEQYIRSARERAKSIFSREAPDFQPTLEAARRFTAAGNAISIYQNHPPANVAGLNDALLSANRALLLKDGIPRRPWFRQAIYAPGMRAGYAAVAIPGVNDGLDERNLQATKAQLAALAAALDSASRELLRYRSGISISK